MLYATWMSVGLWSLMISSSTVYCVLLTMSAETRFRSGVLVVPVDR